MKRVVTGAIAAGLVVAAACVIAARKPSRTIPHATPESLTAELRDRGSNAIVKWIPIVVPLFAVMLLAMVYVIESAVL